MIVYGNKTRDGAAVVATTIKDLDKLNNLISTVAEPGEAAKVVAAYRERQANWGKSDG